MMIYHVNNIVLVMKSKRFKSKTCFYDRHRWYYWDRVIYIDWFFTSYWSSNVINIILFVTTLAYSVTQSLGEMTTYIPVSGSFAQFITRWVSKSCGAANGWLYWFSWAITFALELSVVGQVIQYVDRCCTISWLDFHFFLLTTFNLFPVKYYGEVEFWIASTKVIAIVGWLIYAFCMVCGAGKTGPVGFRYWRNGYAWGDGMIVLNNGKYAISFINGLINAVLLSKVLNWLLLLLVKLLQEQSVVQLKSYVQNFSVLRFVYAFHWSFGSLQRSKAYSRWWFHKKLSIPYCHGKFRY